MELVSLGKFVAVFNMIKQRIPTYRLGQMFITTAIADSTSERMQKLWNMTNTQDALEEITSIMAELQWVDIPVNTEVSGSAATFAQLKEFSK